MGDSGRRIVKRCDSLPVTWLLENAMKLQSSLDTNGEAIATAASSLCILFVTGEFTQLLPEEQTKD